jgi:hypothetical protein
MLIRFCNPPPVYNQNNPVVSTIRHLQYAFKNYTDPLAAFQHHFQRSIF